MMRPLFRTLARLLRQCWRFWQTTKRAPGGPTLIDKDRGSASS